MSRSQKRQGAEMSSDRNAQGQKASQSRNVPGPKCSGIENHPALKHTRTQMSRSRNVEGKYVLGRECPEAETFRDQIFLGPKRRGNVKSWNETSMD